MRYKATLGAKLARSQTFTFSDGLALACAAVLLFSVPTRLGPNPVVLSAGDLVSSLALTAAFALAAWAARGVDTGGAVAGFAVAFAFAARDHRIFWVLLLVFALTLSATHAGKPRKQELRAAEDSRGRSASQVMANLGLAGCLAALAISGWQVLALAALAEAAADTCSSEIGMAFPGRTVLLTSGKPVPAGVDGGVSLHGTISALAAAGIVALAGFVSGLVPARPALAVALAGVLGMLVDSVLGALFERRGLLTNDLVNLLSTAAAAGMAWAMR
ncbi:MAG TPA: DUF92 domain-containing protein [Candidatus Angelobacter sp.]